MNHIADANRFGVVPLTHEAETETRGGIGWLIPALVAGLIISAINNFGDIREGFEDGLNGTPRY